ncbi:MAG: ferritin [Bacteroidales bacterium]
MLSKRVAEALNRQVNAELWSAHLYLSISLHFSCEGLDGMAAWMRKQYSEEVEHAFKILRYMVERGARPELGEIKPVPTQFGSALEIFTTAYEHELTVSESINGLVDISREDRDKATEIFLGWFITEQVEEESAACSIVEKLKRVGDGAGLFLVDRELGARI